MFGTKLGPGGRWALITISIFLAMFGWYKIFNITANPVAQQVAEAFRPLTELSDDDWGKSIQNIKLAGDRVEALPIEARPYLIRLLGSKNCWISRYAATGLARHMDEEIFALLLDKVRENDPDTQGWMVSELVKSKHPRALLLLTPMLAALDANSREQVIKGLQESKFAGGDDIVCSLLAEEPKLDVTREMIKTLAVYGTMERVGPIWEKCNAEKRVWILKSLLSVEDGLDAMGRFVVLRCALSDASDELVLSAFNTIDPTDLESNDLLPCLKKLLFHSNHRIRARAEDYIEVIQALEKQNKRPKHKINEADS